MDYKHRQPSKVGCLSNAHNNHDHNTIPDSVTEDEHILLWHNIQSLWVHSQRGRTEEEEEQWSAPSTPPSCQPSPHHPPPPQLSSHHGWVSLSRTSLSESTHEHGDMTHPCWMGKAISQESIQRQWIQKQEDLFLRISGVHNLLSCWKPRSSKCLLNLWILHKFINNCFSHRFEI